MAISQTSTTEEQTAEEKREQTAAEEYVELMGVDCDTFVFRTGGDGDCHAVLTSGSDAVTCTCPDNTHRGVRCKHMAAYEHFPYIDAFRHDE